MHEEHVRLSNAVLPRRSRGCPEWASGGYGGGFLEIFRTLCPCAERARSEEASNQAVLRKGASELDILGFHVSELKRAWMGRRGDAPGPSFDAEGLSRPILDSALQRLVRAGGYYAPSGYEVLGQSACITAFSPACMFM